MSQAWARLAPLGKPIIPVGQAYDGFAEGGPPGVPNRGSIHRFMGAVADHGGTGVSFWSWQHATDEVWQAVSDAALFQLPAGHPGRSAATRSAPSRCCSAASASACPRRATGATDTYAAVRAFQAASRLPVTGVIDAVTRALLLHPVAPPLK